MRVARHCQRVGERIALLYEDLVPDSPPGWIKIDGVGVSELLDCGVFGEVFG